MKKITYNQYKLLNLREHDFSYKLVEIDLPLIKGQEKMNRQNIEKVMFKIAAHIKGPVASIIRNGKIMLAIPSNRILNISKVQAIPFEVNVKLLPEVFHLQGKDINKENQEIPLKFLTAAIKRQLKAHYDFFELNNSNQFYVKQPVFSDDSSGIDIYEGFFLRIRQFDDGNFYLVLNPTFKYVASEYLSAIISIQNQHYMADRLTGKHCLYQNGDDWYIIEVVGFLRSIGEDRYDGETIINYIKTRTANHYNKVEGLLRPNDLTLLYKYPKRAMQPHHGASSLAKIVYHTKDLDNTALHKYSIQPVEERFERISQAVAQFLQSFSLNKKPLQVSTIPFEEEQDYFPLPELLYNNGKILSVSNSYHDNPKIAVRDYAKARKNHIIDCQILKQTSFDAQYLIYPESLDKRYITAIQTYFENYMKKLAPKFQGFQLIPYQIKPNQAATFQVEEIQRTLLRKRIGSGFALFLFDDMSGQHKSKIKTFHDCLKKKFFPNLKFQCASSKNISRYFETVSDNKEGLNYKPAPKYIDRFKSYLFYLVMEYLKINNKWPYALKNNFHHDIWIGVDVQDRYVGITFLFKNGENIIFKYKEIPRKTGRMRDEKIDSATIISILTENLESQIPRFAPNPNSIAILRDGRVFDDEIKAFETVISLLQSKELVRTDNFHWGVIELHKKSALPLRAACKVSGFAGLENPQAGTFRIIGDKEGYLFNTGYPFKISGTVNPLCLYNAYGNLNFTKAMQDVFDQCMLAFSAPDKSNNLPIIIKLIDSFLSPLADYIDTGEEETSEVYDDETMN